MSDFDITPGFFYDVAGFLKPGDRIDIVRYVNETWNLAVACLPNIRVVSVKWRMVEAIATAEPVFTQHAPEQGFVIDHGPPIRVRHDGRWIGTFGTLVEARELIARKGYSVREDANCMVLALCGDDIETFQSAKAAWKRFGELVCQD